MRPHSLGWGLEILETYLLERGQKFILLVVGGGGILLGRGGGNFVGWATEFWGKLKEILKLHNASIKSISRITNLIYFRDIWKLHLLISEYVFFNRAMTRVFEPLLFFQ